MVYLVHLAMRQTLFVYTGCIPTHVCFTNDPCQFGGTCETGTNNTDYKCLCTGSGNYTGINCSELMCSPDNSYYLYAQLFSTQALKMEPCASNMCQNGGTCSCVGGRDKCSCLNIWTGPNCQRCSYRCGTEATASVKTELHS